MQKGRFSTSGAICSVIRPCCTDGDVAGAAAVAKKSNESTRQKQTAKGHANRGKPFARRCGMRQEPRVRTEA